jgi:hypothetical protein
VKRGVSDFRAASALSGVQSTRPTPHLPLTVARIKGGSDVKLSLAMCKGSKLGRRWESDVGPGRTERPRPTRNPRPFAGVTVGAKGIAK